MPLTFIAAITLSAFTVLADYFLKRASQLEGFKGWPMLLAAIFFYGAPAIGWIVIMRKIKLSTVGVIYGVTTVVLVTLVSVFYFREKISFIEIIGICMAVCSIVILAKFA